MSESVTFEQHARALEVMADVVTERDSARAEVERLRGALERIAASNLVRHREIVDIAREALNGAVREP